MLTLTLNLILRLGLWYTHPVIMSDLKVDYSKVKEEPTEITFRVVVPAGEYQEAYGKALIDAAASVSAPGFRKGKVPLHMVESSKGVDAHKQALETLLSRYASEVLRLENLKPAASPTVELQDSGGHNHDHDHDHKDHDHTEGEVHDHREKGAQASGDLTFLLSVPVIPNFAIADLSKLTVKKPDVTVSTEEIEKVEKQIWQDHKGKFKDKSDAWVAKTVPGLGFSAKTLKELRTELEEAIRLEKVRLTEQEFSQSALREAIKLSKLQIPEALIKQEADERELSFISTLQQMNTTIEEFCKTRAITHEELKKRWRDDATEAVETDVFLAAFASQKGISVEADELEQEVESIKTRSKNASDPLFDNPRWRSYIESVILKRKAFQAFLSEVRSLIEPSAKAERSAEAK
ncbi:MAG: trigger factor [Candidatus Dojkabacteria bacterium]|nr:trigger factor [Candidatus Dojkabacteria bacterium]